MTTTIPEGLEPLAVWDAGAPGWVDANVAEKIAWATAHIERVNDTYRVEFHRLEIGGRSAPLAVVHRYKRNADGYKYQDPETDSIATEPPVIVPLAEPPPAHLLEG